MSEQQTPAASPGPLDAVSTAPAKEALIKNNPIFCQILGICSALAVTTRLANAIVMSAALIFVLVGSNVILSLFRKLIPRRTRMITEMTVIATFVILVDQFLQAYMYQMSLALSVYVGLIITNCIVMGRAEAFALHQPVWPSFWDAIGNGLGYAYVLCAIAFFRELLGSGTLLGFDVLARLGYTKCLFMIYPAGAFITLGIIIWVLRARYPVEDK